MSAYNTQVSWGEVAVAVLVLSMPVCCVASFFPILWLLFEW